MANPGIELRWGVGFDSPDERALVQPLLQTALEITRDGLAELQLDVTDRKRVVVHQLKVADRVADASTSKTIGLYLRPTMMEQTELNSFWISNLMLHEIVHCMRMERYAITSSSEIAATEGLAYVADRQFKNSLYRSYGRKEYGIGLVGRIAMIPPVILRQYRQGFLRATRPHQEICEEVNQEWILDTVPYYFVGKGVMVGIDAVSRHVAAGRQIADLIHLPTSEVLGTN